MELSGGTINGAANTTLYHAIAVAAGTANITPLTDLMVANIVGTANPGAWFAGLASNPSSLSSINQTQVNAALAGLGTALSGLSQLVSSNPVTTSFTPTAGNVIDDMLSALVAAIGNTPGITYPSLLGEVATSTATVTTVPAGFETKLTAAYAAAAAGSYSVGGTVSGLAGSVVLQNNGGNNLTLASNGIFNFSSTIAYGNAYLVTVLTQPAGQSCTVTGGSGTVAANVSGVTVVCSNNAVSGTAGQNVMPIIVDTGSTGVRIIASALSPSLALKQQTSGSGSLDECLQFADGSSWGSVKLADVQLGGEPTLHSLAVQVIGDPAAASIPKSCSSTGAAENTVATFGGNGILGVGSFQQDCGALCVTPPAVTGVYYACSGSSGTSCTPVTVPLAQQIQNPVGMLPGDNNGVAIAMPPVPATGSTAVSGSLILGIGTQANNALGSAAVYGIDPATGTLTTTFNGQRYAGSFLDSGSNALYFTDKSITQCTGANYGFYCPASTTQLTAANQGSNGTSATVSFSVVNANTLLGNASYTAASGLAGTAISGAGFDWGFPFFFGRTVFTSIEGTSSGGVSGPYFAY